MHRSVVIQSVCVRACVRVCMSMLSWYSDTKKVFGYTMKDFSALILAYLATNLKVLWYLNQYDFQHVSNIFIVN